MDILYEDNHIIAVNKPSCEPVQGDNTGDKSLLDEVKAYIKVRDNKPGNVYLGLIHRIDRPVSGVVLFAKTSKCLSRMNTLLRVQSSTLSQKHTSEETPMSSLHKKYHAIVEHVPNPKNGTLCHYLLKNEKQNKSYITDENKGKYAELDYQTLSQGDNYSLVEVTLKTGRHHQIRCQLSHIGCPVKGDLKYGAKRSNPDGSISLHAYEIRFEHPVNHQPITITAPYPKETKIWEQLSELINKTK